jgi:hypothetical protein
MRPGLPLAGSASEATADAASDAIAGSHGPRPRRRHSSAASRRTEVRLIDDPHWVALSPTRAGQAPFRRQLLLSSALGRATHRTETARTRSAPNPSHGLFARRNATTSFFCPWVSVTSESGRRVRCGSSGLRSPCRRNRAPPRTQPTATTEVRLIRDPTLGRALTNPRRRSDGGVSAHQAVTATERANAVQDGSGARKRARPQSTTPGCRAGCTRGSPVPSTDPS